jgi:hypothetical protein
MTLHLQYAPHLYEIDLFSITHAHDLIKSAKKLKALFLNFTLVCGTADIRHDTCKEVEGIDILKDIGSFISDEKDVKIFQGLVYVADLSGFY